MMSSLFQLHFSRWPEHTRYREARLTKQHGHLAAVMRFMVKELTQELAARRHSSEAVDFFRHLLVGQSLRFTIISFNNRFVFLYRGQLQIRSAYPSRARLQLLFQILTTNF